MRFKKQLIVLGIVIAIVATITYALSQTNGNNYPNPGHPASEIGPGTFNCPEGESCLWDFPGSVTINKHLSIGSLYVGSNKKSVTFRVNDLLLGHPERMENPGIALVAGSDTLFVNYNHDWPYTKIGGKVTVSRSLKVKEKLGIPYPTTDTKLYVKGLPEKFAIYGEIPTSSAEQCVSIPCEKEKTYDTTGIFCYDVNYYSPYSCNNDPTSTLSTMAESYCKGQIICWNECGGSGGARGTLESYGTSFSYISASTNPSYCPTTIPLPEPPGEYHEIYCNVDVPGLLECYDSLIESPDITCTVNDNNELVCESEGWSENCTYIPKYSVTEVTCKSDENYNVRTGDTVVGIIGKTQVSEGYLGAIIPNNVPVGVYGYVSRDDGYAGYFKGDLKVEGNKWEDCHEVVCSSGWCNCSNGEYVAGIYIRSGDHRVTYIKCCKL